MELLPATLTFDPNLIQTFTCDTSSESIFHGLQEHVISFVVAQSSTKISSLLCGKVWQNECKRAMYYLEAIQLQHLKIVVVSYLHTYYVCTKFERNLRRVSFFRVDLTWNDPFATQHEVMSCD